MLPVEDKDFFRDYQAKTACIIPRSFFTMLVTDERIDETTLNILLSNQNGRECVWYHAFPYMIDEAYKNGNDKLLRRLLDISRKNNSVAYEKINPVPVYDNYYEYNYAFNYFYIAPKYGGNGHGLVRILESTIKSALDNGDFEMSDEFNSINIEIDNFMKSKFERLYGISEKQQWYIAITDEIRIAKLKLDKTVSKIDLEVQSAIHNGIISIKELKEIKNFATIKKALYEYPIHPFELLYGMYQKQDWQAMFELAVDYDISGLPNAVKFRNKIGIEKSILEIWTNEYQSYNKIKTLSINNDELYISSTYSYSDCNKRNQKSIQSVVDFLGKVRQRIINELVNKVDKEKITGKLTKDYFYGELNKGNKELVIIKLCVRLEAILKCDYNYQGDFSEMLDRFCSQFEKYDDESNSYDPYTPAMLNRLRRQRNSIVHAEKTDEPMTDDEIKQCIDYICSL